MYKIKLHDILTYNVYSEILEDLIIMFSIVFCATHKYVYFSLMRLFSTYYFKWLHLIEYRVLTAFKIAGKLCKKETVRNT